ncbi:hypothetical protein ABIB81_009608 [Bradyrhizobium sp. I1.7.5]
MRAGSSATSTYIMATIQASFANAAEFFNSLLELLIELQAQLAVIRNIARELRPEVARVLQVFADQMGARARAIDKLT